MSSWGAGRDMRGLAPPFPATGPLSHYDDAMGAPSIRSHAIIRALAAHPLGLTTPQVKAIADPDPEPGILCYLILRRYERRGVVCGVRQGAGRGRAITWRLVPRPALTAGSAQAKANLAIRSPARPALTREPARPSERRQATRRAIAFTARRIALLRREIDALAKMEEGIEELEQVEREMAALEG